MLIAFLVGKYREKVAAGVKKGWLFYIRPRFNLFCLKNSLNPFAVDHIQQHECRAYRTL